MYIYAFGSIVRGEIDKDSDIDLLLIHNEKTVLNLDLSKFSVYTTHRIKELFSEGNPFAWHLFYESKLIHSSDVDFLKEIGTPQKYINIKIDLNKFYDLYQKSLLSLNENDFSLVFDLSMIFLSLRNFATCYTLDSYKKPIFSRDSFAKLTDYPLILDEEIFDLLKNSRIVSTRGGETVLSEELLEKLKIELKKIDKWFNKILKKYDF